MALKLISSLDMNDIKQEDVMLYDECGQGNVSGAAVVADGATGFLKDVDVRGNLVSLPDIVSGGYSSARVWAEKLAERLLANMADERLGLRQVLKLSVGEATRQVQPLFGSCERFRTPSAAVIAVRQRGSRWEAVGSGDCCLLLEYRDGRLETVVGSPVLEKIRAAREAEIHREKPDFDNLPAEEKAKVRYFYMKQTRQSLGVFPGGYWVPFYGGDALRAWQAACEAASAQNAARDAESRLRAERTAALLGSVRMFAEAGTVREAQNAIASALAAYRAWHEAEQTAQQAKTRYDALAQALGEIPELPAPARDVSGLTTEQAQAALARTQALAAAVQSQLDQSRGRLEQFGSEAELSAKKQALAQRLDTLNERREALTLARQTLAQANAALAERFSPRLVREASELFSELTGGRYARVQISRQMELEAGQPDAAMRRSLFLSGGTADELYLSVRLAVCRLLLPEDAPLLLDDAFVMFDDDRLRLALRLLQREAANRQILLFTCQHREQKALTTDL